MKKVAIIAIALVAIEAALALYEHNMPVPVAVTVVHVRPLLPKDIDLNTLYSLINQDRATESLTALTRNDELDSSAQAKCADMVAQNYWAHNDPSGQTPWHFLRMWVCPIYIWGRI